MGCDVYLDTDREANVKFYQSRGFKVVYATSLPAPHGSRFPWYIMRWTSGEQWQRNV